jgi:hypothetical protein
MARTARPWWRSRWWTPSFSLFLGVLIFAALALGGEPEDGALGFAVMAVLAAAFLLGSRSETLQGLGGPGRDERWAMIDLRASAFTGMTVLTALIGVWLYELAQGEDGNPYGQILALAGVTYVLAVLVIRHRS